SSCRQLDCPSFPTRRSSDLDVVFYDEEGFDGDVGWAVPGGIAVLPGGARSTGLPIGAAVLSGGSRMTAEHLSAINKDIRAAAKLDRKSTRLNSSHVKTSYAD